MHTAVAASAPRYPTQYSSWEGASRKDSAAVRRSEKEKIRRRGLAQGERQTPGCRSGQQRRHQALAVARLIEIQCVLDVLQVLQHEFAGVLGVARARCLD